jgi:hypothetical protein
MPPLVAVAVRAAQATILHLLVAQAPAVQGVWVWPIACEVQAPFSGLAAAAAVKSVVQVAQA